MEESQNKWTFHSSPKTFCLYLYIFASNHIHSLSFDVLLLAFTSRKMKRSKKMVANEKAFQERASSEYLNLLSCNLLKWEIKSLSNHHECHLFDASKRIKVIRQNIWFCNWMLLIIWLNVCQHNPANSSSNYRSIQHIISFANTREY